MLSMIDFEKLLFRGFGGNHFLLALCDLLQKKNTDNDYKLMTECYSYGSCSLDNLFRRILSGYLFPC